MPQLFALKVNMRDTETYTCRESGASQIYAYTSSTALCTVTIAMSSAHKLDIAEIQALLAPLAEEHTLKLDILHGSGRMLWGASYTVRLVISGTGASVYAFFWWAALVLRLYIYECGLLGYEKSTTIEQLIQRSVITNSTWYYDIRAATLNAYLKRHEIDHMNMYADAEGPVEYFSGEYY